MRRIEERKPMIDMRSALRLGHRVDPISPPIGACLCALSSVAFLLHFVQATTKSHGLIPQPAATSVEQEFRWQGEDLAIHSLSNLAYESVAIGETKRPLNRWIVSPYNAYALV